jgi:hypothetical protein
MSEEYLREVINSQVPYVNAIIRFRCANLFARLWWAIKGDIPGEYK